MKGISTLAALVWAVAAAPQATAQDLVKATPESVGLSSSNLTRATAALQAHVDGGSVAGVVAGVARHGKLVYLEALGQRDLATGDAMPENAIFRLYSMTRPITSTAVMLLWEEGKFQLDDPIAKFLPQFADQRVFLDADNPDMAQTRPRNGDITVRHLLTHSSGIGSRSSAIYLAESVRLRSIPLTQMVDNAARVPLFEDPGTRFRYGISTTILGRLVEVWSGQPFETFLQARVLDPLGMTDTVFWADGERATRLTSVYRPDRESDVLRPYAIEEVPFTERPTLIEGGVGLLSSVMDYVRFAQMFLNGGTLKGARVLKADTVALMTRNHLPETLMPIGDGYMAGSGWGLGFNVVLDDSAYPFPVGQDEYWWDGSSGTRFSIDPEHGIVTVIMAAISPAHGNGFREEFKELVYGALVD
ncbi:MAG: serine hydrolase [Acidobacteria bacterium]|nr:serine hydrolase [Acidobacteriota bacterium]